MWFGRGTGGTLSLPQWKDTFCHASKKWEGPKNHCPCQKLLISWVLPLYRAAAPAELRIINLHFHSHSPPACPSFWTLGCKWCITLLGLLPGHRNFPTPRELKTRLNILVTPVSSLKQMQKTFSHHFSLEFCDKIPCKGWRCQNTAETQQKGLGWPIQSPPCV